MISLKLIGAAALVFGVFLSTACSSDSDETGVLVGALLPLTGGLSTYGETSDAALTDAVDSLQGIRLRVEDTNSDPATALAKLEELKDAGVRIVVGPYSSSEVAAVKAYADENGIILLSPLSTAQTLAVVGDNVLRFTPDDKLEAVALAALTIEDGISTVVPISRDDAGNLGLQTAFKVAFEALGGSVLAPIIYSPDESDFGGEVESLEANVAGGPAGETAVYLTAFAEVTELLARAAGSSSLGQVTWYGSDSVALSKDLVAHEEAAAFAVQVDYPNPILGLSDDDAARWQPVSDRLAEDLGRQPDAFSLAAYDALQVVSEAIEQVGGDAAVTELRDAIVTAAASHQGLTGLNVLNAAGDRASGNYDFWSVCVAADGSFSWHRSATYTVGADGQGVATRVEEPC